MKQIVRHIIFLLFFCSFHFIQAQEIKYPLLQKVLFPNSYKNIITDSLKVIPSVLFEKSTLVPSAFFCKLEHKWDQKLPIKFRFRLGSQEYVDQLEGK